MLDFAKTLSIISGSLFHIFVPLSFVKSMKCPAFVLWLSELVCYLQNFSFLPLIKVLYGEKDLAESSFIRKVVIEE